MTKNQLSHESISKVSIISSSRRKFLAMVGCAIPAAMAPHLCRPSLVINATQSGDRPFPKQEPVSLEIVGAKGGLGNELRPGFDASVVAREFTRVSGTAISAEQVSGTDTINGCGLFTVTYFGRVIVRSYKLWVYLEDAPPDYPVTWA